MKKGFGVVTCGKCGQDTAVFWPGRKFKMPCPFCGKRMNIHRQRLRKFNVLKEGDR